MNLTRNRLRRMILKEMAGGGGMVDPETLETLIAAAKLIASAGALAGIHIAIILEQLARMHAKIQREKDPKSNVNEEDFVAAVMDGAEDELSEYVAPGMGADPETIDAGPYGDFTDGDGDYPYYRVGKKIPGDDYDPGEPPDIDDYDMGRGRGPYGNKEEYDRYSSDLYDYYGGDVDSKYQNEARRLRRRLREMYDSYDEYDEEYSDEGNVKSTPQLSGMGFPGSRDSDILAAHEFDERLYTFPHYDSSDLPPGEYQTDFNYEPSYVSSGDDSDSVYDDYHGSDYDGGDIDSDYLAEIRRLRRNRLRRRR